MKKAAMLSILVAVVSLTIAVIADAQQPKTIPRIGYVSASGNSNSPGPAVEAFRQGLRDFGYTEGNNIQVEYRFIEGNIDRTADLVLELLQLRVALLIVGGFTPVRAARQATTKIPIVMVTTQDPVATGLVKSLAQPGGNITGLTTLVRNLSGKRLELLKEIVPTMSRVAFIWNADEAGAAIGLKEYEAVARALKIRNQSLGVQAPTPDFDAAFQSAVRERANALVAITGTLLNRNAKVIADLAIKNRLPVMYEREAYVEAGGLMSYSANNMVQWRRAAFYVDRLLKGAKPADLPVEQPMKFEFVVNLKAANAIGLTIPQWSLMKADRVIR